MSVELHSVIWHRKMYSFVILMKIVNFDKTRYKKWVVFIYIVTWTVQANYWLNIATKLHCNKIHLVTSVWRRESTTFKLKAAAWMLGLLNVSHVVPHQITMRYLASHCRVCNYLQVLNPINEYLWTVPWQEQQDSNKTTGQGCPVANKDRPVTWPLILGSGKQVWADGIRLCCVCGMTNHDRGILEEGRPFFWKPI